MENGKNTLGCPSCGEGCGNTNQHSEWADYALSDNDSQLDLTDAASINIINIGDVAVTLGDYVLIEPGDERSICAVSGTVLQGSKKLTWAANTGLRKLAIEKIFVVKNNC